MKLPFQRDTAAEVRKTTDALASAGAKLTALRAERSRLLVESDDLVALQGADTSIVAEERFISTLQERLQKLEGLRRKEREVLREQNKEKAVQAFAKAYREQRVSAAADIIEALGKLGDCWVAYAKTANEPWQHWRNDLFPSMTDRYSPFTPTDHLLDRIANVLGMRIEIANSRLPEIRARTAEIAGGVAEQADAYINALREAPLPPAAADDEEAA